MLGMIGRGAEQLSVRLPQRSRQHVRATLNEDIERLLDELRVLACRRDRQLHGDRFANALARLEHGQPLKIGEDRGVVFGEYGRLTVVDLADVSEDQLVVHDAHRADPSYAFALAQLDEPAFEHVPIGVFRDVEAPTYEEAMAEQIEQARATQGEGDLMELLAGSDTWTIK